MCRCINKLCYVKVENELQKGMAIKDIPHLTQLAPGGSISVTMGIDFNDTLQPAKFDLW